MKMKLFLFLAAFFFASSAFAQQVKVLDVSGEVLVKQDASQKDWKKVTKNMILNKSAELETKQDAYCTLAFDDKNMNISTIKQNSRIKIQSIKPADIFVSGGRVFAAVRNLAASEKFEVRCPIAVSGVRGTYEDFSFGPGLGAHVRVFEGTVYTQNTDQNGNVLGGVLLAGGQGVGIGPDGRMGETRALRDADYVEYDDFRGYISDLGGGSGGQGGTGGGTGPGSGSGVGDSRQDQRDDQHNNFGEQKRKEGQGGNDGGSKGSTGSTGSFTTGT